MKIKEFQKKLIKEHIDCAVILSSGQKDINLFYFTNLDIEFGILFVPKKGSPIFAVSSLEYERAKKFSKIKNIVKLESKKDFQGLFKKHINKKIVGLNLGFVSVNLEKNVKKLGTPKKILDISSMLVSLREIKTSEEIKKIKTACLITKKIFNEIVDNFDSFSTEKDILIFMKKKMLEFNVEPSFPPIVASAKNASMPHSEPKDKLKRGFCILDFGVIYQGYCSDVTRTIFIGTPSKNEIDIYTFLLNIQKNAITDLKVGQDVFEFDKSVRKKFGIYEKNFIHGLGHSLGLEAHDPHNGKFLNGFVFTIEPGIYIEGNFGIRIEDDVLLTNSGAQILTKINKELICVKHKQLNK